MSRKVAVLRLVIVLPQLQRYPFLGKVAR
jgi:hypothetical protein